MADYYLGYSTPPMNDAYELSHKKELGVYTVFDVIAVCGYDVDQSLT